MRFRTKSSRSGFLLPVMAGLLLAMGSAATVVVVQKENLTFWQPKTESTQDLTIIRNALVAFQRDNHRLPCVASRSALPGATNYGTELTDCTIATAGAAGTLRINIGGGNFMRLGALPHTTLKLGTTGGEDRWGTRFTYAMVEKLADPYQFTTGQGALIIQNETAPIMATAAWVVVSHGADGKGAFSPKLGSTTPVKGCTSTAGLDQENCDEFTGPDGIFRKVDLNSAPGSSFFDDMVAYDVVDSTAQQTNKPCQRTVIGDASWDSATCSNNTWTDMLHGVTGQNISNTNTSAAAGTATLSCSNGTLVYSTPVCNSHCISPGTKVWGSPHDCSATVGTVSHGANSGSIANTVTGRTGNATFNCSDGALALGAWSCTPNNCGAQSFNWPAGCTGNQASLTHGNVATVTNTAGTYDGTINVSCNYGQYSSNTAVCNAKCPAQTFNWGAGCTANAAQMSHGASPTITNTNVPYTGSQTLLCNSGTWSVTASECFAHCAASTLGWPAGCSAPAAAMSHGQTGQALTNSAGGYTGTATASCTNGTMTAVGNCYANCNATPLNWGPGSSCGATPATMVHGAAAQTITDAPAGYTGSASITCTNGTYNVAPIACNAPCNAASVNWGSNCYGSATTMYHGQATQTVTDTTPGYTGTSNVTCSNGTFGVSSVSCTADPCVSQTLNWSGSAAGCSGTYPGSASGSTGTVNNAVGGKSGAINYSCTASVLSTNSPTCYDACAGTVTWGSCSAYVTGNHGQSGIAITNTAGGFQGSATGSCTNGTMSLSGTSCVPTVNGVCGTSNGGHTTSAPSSNLCSTGSPTGVTGSGPYSWSCTGSGGGTTASCGSNRACAGTTISWNGAVSGCNNGISDRNSGTSGSISNAVSGRNGSTTWACNQGTWSNSSPSCNGDSCASQAIGWSGAASGCTGTAPGLGHGAGPTSVTNSAGGKTGAVNVSCSFGALSQSGATCADISGTCSAYRRLCDTGPYSDYQDACTASGGTPQTQGGSGIMNCFGNTEMSYNVRCCGGSCPNQTLNWSSCSASLGGSLGGGETRTVNNTAGGYTGSTVAACDAGTLSQSGSSCTPTATCSPCATYVGTESDIYGTGGSAGCWDYTHADCSTEVDMAPCDGTFRSPPSGWANCSAGPPCTTDGSPPGGGGCCNSDTDGNGLCGYQPPAGDPCFDNGYGSGCLTSGSDYGTGCIGTDIFGNGTVCCAGCTTCTADGIAPGPGGCCNADTDGNGQCGYQAPPGASCASGQTRNWTGPGYNCTGTTDSAIAHNAYATIVDEFGFRAPNGQGTATFHCNNGVLSGTATTSSCSSAPMCPGGCEFWDSACGQMCLADGEIFQEHSSTSSCGRYQCDGSTGAVTFLNMVTRGCQDMCTEM